MIDMDKVNLASNKLEDKLYDYFNKLLKEDSTTFSFKENENASLHSYMNGWLKTIKETETNNIDMNKVNLTFNKLTLFYPNVCYKHYYVTFNDMLYDGKDQNNFQLIADLTLQPEWLIDNIKIFTTELQNKKYDLVTRIEKEKQKELNDFRNEYVRYIEGYGNCIQINRFFKQSTNKELLYLTSNGKVIRPVKYGEKYVFTPTSKYQFMFDAETGDTNYPNYLKQLHDKYYFAWLLAAPKVTYQSKPLFNRENGITLPLEDALTKMGEGNYAIEEYIDDKPYRQLITSRNNVTQTIQVH